MTHEENSSLWYAVYKNGDRGLQHVGSYHSESSRDADGHRIQDHRIVINGEGLHHRAHCRLVLERRAGRLAPLRVDYDEPGNESSITFDDGRMRATGAAQEHDGAPVPKDGMPTYGISMLAQTIYNQPESSLGFDAMVDATGTVCGANAKLVSRGQTDKTPFPTVSKLWEVEWLSNEGTRRQAFYFTDEGILSQADWGTTFARLIDGEVEATPSKSDSAEEDPGE